MVAKTTKQHTQYTKTSEKRVCFQSRPFFASAFWALSVFSPKITLHSTVAVLDRVWGSGGLQGTIGELLVVAVVAAAHGPAICHCGVADAESPNIHVCAVRCFVTIFANCSANQRDVNCVCNVGVCFSFFLSFCARCARSFHFVSRLARASNEPGF